MRDSLLPSWRVSFITAFLCLSPLTNCPLWHVIAIAVVVFRVVRRRCFSSWRDRVRLQHLMIFFMQSLIKPANHFWSATKRIASLTSDRKLQTYSCFHQNSEKYGRHLIASVLAFHRDLVCNHGLLLKSKVCSFLLVQASLAFTLFK